MREMGNWRAYLMKRLADRKKAINYLDVSLEEYQIDGDTSFFLKGLRNVIEAQGGVGALAKRIQVDAETLSEVLSSENAPQLDTFINIITALGGRLSIAPLEAANPSFEVATEAHPAAPREVAAPRAEVATESG